MLSMALETMRLALWETGQRCKEGDDTCLMPSRETIARADSLLVLATLALDQSFPVGRVETDDGDGLRLLWRAENRSLQCVLAPVGATERYDYFVVEAERVRIFLDKNVSPSRLAWYLDWVVTGEVDPRSILNQTLPEEEDE